jgi:serine/threonine-protein kinase
VGSVIAGYTVVRVIGAGSLGTVFAAQDPELPRLVALKVISAEMSRDSGFVTRLAHHVDTATSLDHRNIATVYNFGRTDDQQLWLATQYIDGANVDAALRVGPIDLDRTVRIIQDLSAALDYAHRRGILHRNLTPANVLLPRRDERTDIPYAILTDFGLAGALDDHDGTGLIAPALVFAAPEISSSADPVGHRADIYALGGVLHFLLTGAVPYPGAHSLAAVAMAHREQPPPQPSAADPRLAPFDAVIAAAMNKDPDKRPSSAAQLAASTLAAARAVGYAEHPPSQPAFAALKRDTSAEPTVIARPPISGPTLQAPAPRRRRRGVLIAGGAALAVIAAVSTVVALIDRNGDSTAQDAPTTPAPTISAPNPPTTVAPVTPAALPELLLSAQQISDAIAVPMTGKVVSSGMGSDSTTVDHPDCAAVLYPVQRTLYGKTGMLDNAYQQIDSTDPSRKAAAVQSVAAFPTAEQAQALLLRAQTQWLACANTSLTAQPMAGNPERHWELGDVKFSNSMLTAAITSQDAQKPESCQHAMTVRNNVVIDIAACASNGTAGITDQARALATELANKIPTS